MKLLLADDHTLFRDALVQYIERANADAQVSVAEDFYQAFEIMKENDNQDLVLLDFRMPGMMGLEGFQKMRDTFPDTPIALMSGVAEAEDVQAAIDMGAAGYFPKTLSGKALLNALQSVLDGEVYIPHDKDSGNTFPSYYEDEDFSPRETSIAYMGMQKSQQAIIDDNQFNLTPREHDVLEYLMTGASNKEIANALSLQVVTVKLHVRGICRKLGAKNRTQAALIASENGYVAKVSNG